MASASGMSPRRAEGAAVHVVDQGDLAFTSEMLSPMVGTGSSEMPSSTAGAGAPKVPPLTKEIRRVSISKLLSPMVSARTSKTLPR